MVYVYAYLGCFAITLLLVLALIQSSPRNNNLEESFEREERKDAV